MNTANNTAADPTTIVPSASGGLNEGFESGAAGWTPSGLWHLSNNSPGTAPAVGYTSPTHAYYYGQDTMCSYDTGVANSGSLTSPGVTVTAQSTLQFNYYLRTEGAAAYDRAEVYVVPSGGTETKIYTVPTNDTSWHTTTPTISLAQFAGQQVQIPFKFDTVDSYANILRAGL